MLFQLQMNFKTHQFILYYVGQTTYLAFVGGKTSNGTEQSWTPGYQREPGWTELRRHPNSERTLRTVCLRSSQLSVDKQVELLTLQVLFFFSFLFTCEIKQKKQHVLLLVCDRTHTSIAVSMAGFLFSYLLYSRVLSIRVNFFQRNRWDIRIQKGILVGR